MYPFTGTGATPNEEPPLNNLNDDNIDDVSEMGASFTEQSEMDKLKQELAELKENLQQQTINTAIEMQLLKKKIEHQDQQIMQSDFMHLLLNDDVKLKFYTGISNRGIFQWILETTKCYVSINCQIPKEKQLLIVFVKIRQNLLNEDIAIRFNTSRRTVARIFESWLPILAGRLKHLIYWPSKHQLKKNLPKCFKNSIYKETVCIIDCTEIFTQRPSNTNSQNKMWSNYKHHLTLKILIGITPNGQVCYVSNCWGGRVSDKEITLNCGILNYLKPGDVVLADRGFKISNNFNVQGINLVLPTFTKGKKQLSYKEVLRSKRISNVRIHIERVIGYLKNFQILKSIIPITMLKYIDCIFVIICGIHNLNAPVVL